MTINQSENSPGGLMQKIQTALAGVQQALPDGSSLTMNGQVVTKAQLVAQLSGLLPPLTAVTDARSAHAKAIQAREAAEPNAREFLAQLRAALVSFYGRGSTSLLDFGMSAKKPAVPTSRTAILAAAKRTLTRQKRGTLGSKQKASIKAIGTPQVSISESGVQITPAAGDQPAVTPVETSSTPETPAPVGTPPAK